MLVEIFQIFLDCFFYQYIQWIYQYINIFKNEYINIFKNIRLYAPEASYLETYLSCYLTLCKQFLTKNPDLFLFKRLTNKNKFPFFLDTFLLWD